MNAAPPRGHLLTVTRTSSSNPREAPPGRPAGKRATSLALGSAALLLAAAAGATGCRALTAEREVLRLGNWSDLSERELGLAAQASSVAQAESAARAKGLAGLRSDSYVADGLAVTTLSADFQTRVHVFENDRYAQSVALRCGSTPPYGTVVRLADSDEGLLLLALYRSPADLVSDASAAGGPRMDVFVRRGRAFEFLRTIPLDDLAAARGGVTSPLLVGHDLADGVIFLARDRDGVVWESAYLMSMTGGVVGFKPLPLDEAVRCSCVSDYIYGG